MSVQKLLVAAFLLDHSELMDILHRFLLNVTDRLYL